jgi:hypothetical protein
MEKFKKKEKIMKNEIKDGYQVLVVNIKYGKELNNKVKYKPETTVLDIPENILKTQKDEYKFKNNIETFVYNTLSKKYNVEINSCQIWLPFN